MKILRFLVVILLCLAIGLPTVAGWGRFRGRRIARFVRRVGDTAKKIANPLCKAYVKVGCPVTATLSTAAAAAVYAGCKIADHTNQCDKIFRRKRSAGEIEVEDGMVYFPIPDDFEEYDDNKDDLIEYEEFAFEFLARWSFTKSDQLRDIFNDADTDDDGYLDLEEFVDAPWDFGSYDVKVQKTPIYNGTPLLSESPLADD